MTNGALAERIRGSFSTSIAIDAITNVKTAVSEYIRATDPAVAVERTSYFNHSFAPDLVLRWPRENASRYVYLRANNDPAWLLEDIDYIGNRQPLVITLAAAPIDASMKQVGVSAQSHNTMVTEPGMLESLGQARREEAIAGLLSSALLQGGRGIVGEARVDAAVRTTTVGFDAAETLTPEPTRRTTELLADILNGPQSGRLTRLLRAVWEGHGGSSSTFPAATGIAASLSGSDLRYLLESVGVNDFAFWRKIGRNLTLDLITQIPPDDMPATFQHLVNANVTTLLAKAARHEAAERQLGDDENVFEWLLHDENLSLRGNDFISHLAATTVDSLPRMARRDGPSIAMVQDRVSTNRRNLSKIRLTDNQRTITYESAANLIVDQGFSDLLGTLGPEARVDEATVLLKDGKRLTCDFEESTAKGQTNAMFAINQLLGVSVPLMVPVDEAMRVRLLGLANLSPVGPDGSSQLLLFDGSPAEEIAPQEERGA